MGIKNNIQPIAITNKCGKNGVLISEEDWNAIEETLYLNSLPNMTESIMEAGREPLEECPIYGIENKSINMHRGQILYVQVNKSEYWLQEV